MRCPNCGTESQPGAQFCRHCAAPLIGVAAPGRAAPDHASPAASLVAQSGLQAGQTFTLRDGVNTVGRDPGNDVLLTESSVSRSHARIVVRPEGVWIEDLGSTSGTFVNGQRVTASTWLRAGDTVQVGGSVILGAQVTPAMAPAFPAAPPSVGMPTAAVPLVAAQPQAMQICPRCGAQNRPGVRFCEHCAAPLVEVAPAVPGPPPRRRRLRRWLKVAGIGLFICLILPVLASVIDYAQYNIRHRPRISQDEALQVATEIIAGEYQQFAGSTPVVQETEFDRDKGYRVVYTVSDVVETEDGSAEFTHMLVININAVTEEVSVAISQ